MTTSNKHYIECLMERVKDIPQAKKPICPGQNWDQDIGAVQAFDELFTALGSRFNLDIYPNQYKICSSKAMMDAYAHVGMPVMYRHWSFGKSYLQTERAYTGGDMGLAYEIVINSDPCISVNMIDNTTAMTALVMAHAAQGHNSFFKGNYMFRDWTDAEGIMPYLRFAKGYIDRCYEQIGEAPVRQFLSSCHALQNMGVDRYKRRKSNSFKSEAQRLQAMETAFQQNFNPTMNGNAEAQRAAKAMIERNKKRLKASVDYSSGGAENLLYVLEKESIAAKQSELVQGSPWMVEVMRIVRQIAQYFYPQKQTQVMNEGWASFWHHALTTIAHEKGYLTDGQYQEIIDSHSGVIAQPDYNSPYYSGSLNPYKLGFEMYRDIMFMARGPKDIAERRRYEDCNYEEDFANKVYYQDGKQHSFLNTDWLDLMHYAMRNFRDESFVREFLSAGVCRDFKFFSICDDDQENYLEVTGIQSDLDVIRDKLSNQYDLSKREPQIAAVGFDPYGDRTLHLEHRSESGAPLGDSANDVMQHINVLLRGPEALPSHIDFKAFKSKLKSYDMRDPENPILLDNWPIK